MDYIQFKKIDLHNGQDNPNVYNHGAQDTLPNMNSSTLIDVKIEVKEEKLDFHVNNVTLTEDESTFGVIKEETNWYKEHERHFEKDRISDEIKYEEFSLETLNAGSNISESVQFVDKHKCQDNPCSKDHLEEYVHSDLGQEDEACHLCDFKKSHEENIKVYLKTKNITSAIPSVDNHKKRTKVRNKKLTTKLKSLKQIKDKDFQCDTCCYTTKHKKNLELHMNTIHLNMKNFVCEICKYATARKDNLRQHIEMVHKKLKGYPCEMCDFATTKKCLLKYHVGVMHLNLDENWQLKAHHCVRCDYKTARKDHLKAHMQNVHNKVKIHQCSVCGYRAAQKFTIRQHFRIVHLNVKDYACSMCEFRAPRKYNLEQHIKGVHMKLKDFKCSSCNYSASSRGNVTQHMKRVHMRVKSTNSHLRAE